MMPTNKIVLLTFIVYLSCKQSKGILEISQTKTNAPVVVHLYDNKEVGEIRLPVEITIKNLTDFKQEIFKYTYRYQNGHRFPAILEIKENDNYVKIKNSSSTIIRSKESVELRLTTRHRIDIEDTIQENFSVLKSSLNLFDKKKLEIKSIDEFRTLVPDFFESFTKKDSLIFVFFKFDDNDKPIYNREVIPIKY